jgi:hypothetical protein
MNPPREQARRFGGSWAKAELFLGLAAAGGGLLLGVWAASRAEVEWLAASAGLALFVLGGYLALAGQRSHVYRSNIELESRLIARLNPSQEKVEPR